MPTASSLQMGSSRIKPRITVLGAGVTGLTCALELSASATITIVARNMPGDPLSLGWSSPWAGAMWLPSAGDKGEAKEFPVLSYRKFKELSAKDPESSVKWVGCYDYRDALPENLKDSWYSCTEELRVLKPDEIKLGAKAGLYYKTMTLDPEQYILWLRRKCEKAGVRFTRYDATSLEEATKVAPCDAIVNATGVGARHLRDVADDKVTSVRGQTMIVKCDATEIEACHSDKYTYVIPHGDGTATLGGIKEYHDFEPGLKDYVQRAIHKRCREICPEHIPENFEDLEVIRHNVGFRPERGGVVRCEAEVQKGRKIVHAYGMMGGYVYSWGLAQQVKKLVDELVSDSLEGVVQAKL